MRKWIWNDLERSVDKNPNGAEEPSQIPPGRERQDLRCLGSTLFVLVLELVKEQQKGLVFKRRPSQTVRHYGEVSHAPRNASPKSASLSLGRTNKLAKLRPESGRPES